MKLVKVFAVVLIILAIGGGLAWQLWLKEQVGYARVATAYGAKMVCSCRYVAGREMDSCKQDFTQDVSAVTFEDGDNAVRTQVLGGVISAEARFEPGLGCTLVRD